MNINGTIVIIEDDADDRDMLFAVFKDLGYKNELRFFPDGEKALEYLSQPDANPFLIISDINMPKMDGFALRKIIQSDRLLHAKCMPYIFFSTAGNSDVIENAYAMSVQGYFTKPGDYNELKILMRRIIEYWKSALTPRR